MNTPHPALQKALSERPVSERSDCAVVALALVTDVPYLVAHQALALSGRKPRSRTSPDVFETALGALGFEAVAMGRYRTFLRVERVLCTWPEPILVWGHNHVAALLDGRLLEDGEFSPLRRVLGVYRIRRIGAPGISPAGRTRRRVEAREVAA
ncbi:MAG: hypothetical protein RIB46_01285 [Pseudomonadales bacterium]